MKIWDKTDEVIGAGILGSVACYAIYMGFDGNLAAICATGIITLLAASAGGKGGNGSVSA
jgi:hypothetical protein